MNARTILIVDDDPFVCEALVEALQPEGFEVQTAHDGQHALELLRTGLAPVLILLDLQMPTLDGLHFRTVQMQTPEISSIPVVVMTADAAIEKNWPGLTAAQILHKPLRREQLLSAIEQHAEAPATASH